MAWTKRQFRIVFFWEDREGTKTSTTIQTNFSGTGILDGLMAINKAKALAPLIQPLSSCALTGYKVISSYTDEAAAYAGEVERRAEFQFISAMGRPYKTRIPGFKDTLLDANGRDITVRGAGVKAEVSGFIDAILNGPAGWSNGAVTIGGEQLTAVKRAKKIHVPSLRVRPRASG